MKVDVKFLSAKDCFLVTVNGEVSGEVFVSSISDLYARREYSLHTNVIWDLNGISGFANVHFDPKVIGRLIASRRSARVGKLMMVSEKSIESNIFSTFCQAMSEAGQEILFFKSLDEAFTFLSKNSSD
ncbi:MAG: hypothetical protein COA42_15955 [Alteromonadaceae bacterium]|nr:MAG: hypothetical protein COA42_15955 [Alteromonadaceae bacterium]